MRRLDKIPFVVWFFVGCAWWSCKPAQAPATDDVLHDLAVAVEAAERAAPVARAACGLAPEEQRAACLAGVDGLEVAAQNGRDLLDTATACREAQDEECLASAIETARLLAKILRGAL